MKKTIEILKMTKGSEKQIKWAEKIQANLISDFNALIERTEKRVERYEGKKAQRKIIEKLDGYNLAKRNIENVIDAAALITIREYDAKSIHFGNEDQNLFEAACFSKG